MVNCNCTRLTMASDVGSIHIQFQVFQTRALSSSFTMRRGRPSSGPSGASSPGHQRISSRRSSWLMMPARKVDSHLFSASLHLSFCLSICLSPCLCLCVFVCLSLFVSFPLSISPSCLAFSVSLYPSFLPSLYPSLSLSSLPVSFLPSSLPFPLLNHPSIS